MTSDSRRVRAAGAYKRRTALALLSLSLVGLTSSACGSRAGSEGQAASGVVIVNAPTAGEVRRVLAREGMTVAKGDPVLEIVVREEAKTTPRAEDPVARAGQGVRTAESEVEAARAEVVRAEVEVQRLTPLVAGGQASQGELDGARALYERAQQRLRQAQDASRDAQSGLVAARQPRAASPTVAAPTPAEHIVYARATSAGTVSVLSAREGDRVAAGQPLATLRAGGH
jgi:multidrug efflux pump subunit AcrA (membrane-fusion protein)